MWEQIFSLPGVRLATSPNATTIKPPADMRAGMSAAARRDELTRWWARMHEPGFTVWWDDAVQVALRRVAVDAYRDIFDLVETVERERARQTTAESP
jgi:hypothetical protein